MTFSSLAMAAEKIKPTLNFSPKLPSLIRKLASPCHQVPRFIRSEPHLSSGVHHGEETTTDSISPPVGGFEAKYNQCLCSIASPPCLLAREREFSALRISRASAPSLLCSGVSDGLILSFFSACFYRRLHVLRPVTSYIGDVISASEELLCQGPPTPRVSSLKRSLSVAVWRFMEVTRFLLNGLRMLA